jgi:hypothetical protein
MYLSWLACREWSFTTKPLYLAIRCHPYIATRNFERIRARPVTLESDIGCCADLETFRILRLGKAGLDSSV